MFMLFALLLGSVAGFRAVASPAVFNWAAKMGIVAVVGTPLAFMGFKYTDIIFTVLAAGELIDDKRPKTLGLGGTAPDDVLGAAPSCLSVICDLPRVYDGGTIPDA